MMRVYIGSAFSRATGVSQPPQVNFGVSSLNIALRPAARTDGRAPHGQKQMSSCRAMVSSPLKADVCLERRDFSRFPQRDVRAYPPRASIRGFEWACQLDPSPTVGMG